MRTVPWALFPSTMLRPLNSAIARSTVRRSAPSTSRLKLPVDVRTRPTSWPAVFCAATGAAKAAASSAAQRMPKPAFLVSIRVSLPHERNHHRLTLTVRGDVHHHGIPTKRFDDTVLHLVALAQHVAVAARVLDHGELVRGAPDDAHDLHAAGVHRGWLTGRRVPRHVLAGDQRLERVATAERVVLIGDVLVDAAER